ncbi:MAG TPA: cobalamin biosynthesis protein CbiG, partial [Phenylobacterium sp.]|nr:cobalamin biosynthesis protein CbiG [Phenylobacterium sp.]
MPRLFSAYVIVDWSAASKPTTGADSVWIGVLKRDVRFRMAFEAFNPATRTEAEAKLGAILDDLKKRSERALVGFDFSLGFPRGFADALKLKGEPWRAAWDELGKRVVDKPTNVNNRFNVAAQLNRLLT